MTTTKTQYLMSGEKALTIRVTHQITRPQIEWSILFYHQEHGQWPSRAQVLDFIRGVWQGGGEAWYDNGHPFTDEYFEAHPEGEQTARELSYTLFPELGRWKD